MTEPAVEDDPGPADGHAAGPGSGQGPGRRARRLHPPDPAPPHQPRHRRGRHGARPVRAHPGPRLPVLRRAGQDAAGSAVPGRLAPRGRTRHDPDPATEDQQWWVDEARRGPAAPRPGRRGRAGHRRPGRAHPRAGRGDHQVRPPRQRRPGPARPAAPLHPAPPGRPGPAQPQGQPAHRRQDLHRAGRQDLPPVAVRHPDLPVLRPGRRRRSTRRPGRLRLRPGRPGRAALRRAVRPVHPEPAPLPRLRRAVLRRHRTPAPARPARPPRHPRHHRPRRAAPGPRRHLPPGLVARRPGTSSTTATSCPSGTTRIGGYLDPATGEVLPTWDQALDAIGDR